MLESVSAYRETHISPANCRQLYPTILLITGTPEVSSAGKNKRQSHRCINRCNIYSLNRQVAKQITRDNHDEYNEVPANILKSKQANLFFARRQIVNSGNILFRNFG